VVDMGDLGVRVHVGQGTTRGALTLFPIWTDRPSAGPAGLASRVRGGGRVTVDSVRWSDRTVHLTAVASEA
jgi:hypothetical protein